MRPIGVSETIRTSRTATLMVAAALLITSTAAPADPAAGSVGVTATVVGSITIHLQAGHTAIESSGNLLSFPVRIGVNATAPGFLTRRTTEGWSVSTPCFLRVDRSNIGAATYSVNASLADPPPAGTRWRLSGTPLSRTPAFVARDRPYGSEEGYLLEITVDEAAVRRDIEDIVVFVVITD